MYKSKGDHLKKIRFISPGTIIGERTVIELVGVGGKWRRALYRVSCVCGNEQTINGSDLRKSNSCGCIRKAYLGEGESARRVIWRSYVAAAENRGLEWSLSVEQFNSLILGVCTYCGESATRRKPSPTLRSTVLANGIDRMDSELGYTAENCVSCCCDCDRMKMNRSLGEFLSRIEKIHKYQRRKRNANQ